LKPIVCLLIILINSISTLAQPVDSDIIINESAYTQPFLHCVVDEKYFAKYAIESHSSLVTKSDIIHCKLHVPTGLNQIWQDMEKSGRFSKGEFDYSNSASIGIRYIFYVNGVQVSTAYQSIEKVPDETPFTQYFTLNQNDSNSTEGDLNFAYKKLLSRIQKSFSGIAIEAVIPSMKMENNVARIATATFHLKNDLQKPLQSENLSIQEQSGQISNDHNKRLRYLSDSTMKRIFGETGFSKYFTMACLQNPCAKGYTYANTMVTTNPCSSTPQDTCKEAIITYSYKKAGVPLTIKMLVSLKDNGEYIYIENNQYGKREVSIERQNLLSIAELQTKMKQEFPKQGLTVIDNHKSLAYTHTRIAQPNPNVSDELKTDPGYKLIKETKFGRNWEGGFTYVAGSNDQKKSNQVYHFDATKGKLLWITEFHIRPLE
jgi:hypothetical protein